MVAKIEIENPVPQFLLALFAVFAALILLNAGHFLVPDSDFFDYAEKASQLRQLQWPDHFKRPPLYPLTIALISAPIPGKHTELFAAEVIGVLCALLSLWLLWRLSRRLIAGGAPWLVWIWAFHPTTLSMALKPKPEMLLTCLLLWAFERFLQGDRRAYLIAFAATMVRYEGVLAIGAFFLADLFLTRQKGRAFIYAVLASTFILGWSLFQSSGESMGGTYNNYFSGYRLNFHFLYLFWSELLAVLPLVWFKVWFVLALIAFSLGAIDLWRRNRQATLAMGGFLAAFWLLHIIWPFSGPDYVVMGGWTALIFIVSGLMSMVAWLGFKLERKKFKWNFALSLVFLAITLAALIGIRFDYAQYQPQWPWVLLILLPLALYLFFRLWPEGKKTALIAVLTIMIFISFHLHSRLRNTLYELYYAKAEFRLAGEWFAAHRQPQDRLFISQPNIAAYYTDLNPERDFIGLADSPDLPPAELITWMSAKKITHVAWLSYQRMAEQGIAWSEWVNENRKLDRIAFLQDGADHPGLRCVARLEAGPRRAFIYRVE